MTWTSASAHCKCLTLVMNPTHDYKLTRQAQSVQWTSFQRAASDDLWNSVVACAAFGNTGAWDASAQRSQSLLWNSVPITSAACDRYKISVRLTQQCRREVLPGPSLQYWLSMLWDSGVHFNWTKVVHIFFFPVFYWLFTNMNADSNVSFTTVQTLQACMNKRFCSSHTLQLSCTMLAFTATWLGRPHEHAQCQRAGERRLTNWTKCHWPVEPQTY